MNKEEVYQARLQIEKANKYQNFWDDFFEKFYEARSRDITNHLGLVSPTDHAQLSSLCMYYKILNLMKDEIQDIISSGKLSEFSLDNINVN